MKCKLRQIMVDKNIKDISEVMRKTGLCYNTVKKLYYQEQLDTVKLNTIKIVCDTLDCDIEDLIKIR